MFRRTILRSFRSSNFIQNTFHYTPPPPPNPDEDKNIRRFISILILGGAVGGGKFGSEAYKDTKEFGYIRCVSETTWLTIMGFTVGMATTLMLPVLIPIGTVVAVMRYFDYTNKTKNNINSKLQ